MPAPRASEAVIRNAIKAAKACGLVVGVVEVDKDGSGDLDEDEVTSKYVLCHGESADKDKQDAQEAEIVELKATIETGNSPAMPATVRANMANTINNSAMASQCSRGA